MVELAQEDLDIGMHRKTILMSPRLRLKKRTIDIPVLFIAATKDEALPPSMSRAMDEYIPNLTRKSVDTRHWALWERPDEVNQIIREWLESITSPRASHL